MEGELHREVCEKGGRSKVRSLGGKEKSIKEWVREKLYRSALCTVLGPASYLGPPKYDLGNACELNLEHSF